MLRQFKLFRLLCPLTLCGLRFAWWVTFRSLPPLTVLRQILGRYFFFLWCSLSCRVYTALRSDLRHSVGEGGGVGVRWRTGGDTTGLRWFYVPIKLLRVCMSPIPGVYLHAVGENSRVCRLPFLFLFAVYTGSWSRPHLVSRIFWGGCLGAEGGKSCLHRQSWYVL